MLLDMKLLVRLLLVGILIPLYFEGQAQPKPLVPVARSITGLIGYGGGEFYNYLKAPKAIDTSHYTGIDSLGAMLVTTNPRNAWIRIRNSTNTSNIWLGMGSSLTVDSTTLYQQSKDVTITFISPQTYADIPLGIDYDPITINVTVTNAVSTEGDTGLSFLQTYTSSTKTLRLSYDVSPLGTFSYHIVMTKASKINNISN